MRSPLANASRALCETLQLLIIAAICGTRLTAVGHTHTSHTSSDSDSGSEPTAAGAASPSSAVGLVVVLPSASSQEQERQQQQQQQQLLMAMAANDVTAVIPLPTALLVGYSMAAVPLETSANSLRSATTSKATQQQRPQKQQQQQKHKQRQQHGSTTPMALGGGGGRFERQLSFNAATNELATSSATTAAAYASPSPTNYQAAFRTFLLTQSADMMLNDSNEIDRTPVVEEEVDVEAELEAAVAQNEDDDEQLSVATLEAAVAQAEADEMARQHQLERQQRREQAEIEDYMMMKHIAYRQQSAVEDAEAATATAATSSSSHSRAIANSGDGGSAVVAVTPTRTGAAATTAATTNTMAAVTRVTGGHYNKTLDLSSLSFLSLNDETILGASNGAPVEAVGLGEPGIAKNHPKLSEQHKNTASNSNNNSGLGGKQKHSSGSKSAAAMAALPTRAATTNVLAGAAAVAATTTTTTTIKTGIASATAAVPAEAAATATAVGPLALGSGSFHQIGTQRIIAATTITTRGLTANSNNDGHHHHSDARVRVSAKKVTAGGGNGNGIGGAGASGGNGSGGNSVGSSKFVLPKAQKTDAPMLNYIFDTFSSANKHHHHDQRYGPHFEDMDVERLGQPTNMTVQAGSSVHLNCRISLLQDKTVSWVRRNSQGENALDLLTVGMHTYTGEGRYKLEFQYPNNWRLKIVTVRKEDEAVYECQISTHPPRVLQINLHVNAPKVMIVDEFGDPLQEKYYEIDSTLQLSCVVRNVAMTTSVVYWQHADEMLNYDVTRGGVSVKTELMDDGANSTLSIAKINKADSGNYSCSINEFQNFSIIVHILNGESFAELHHGGAAASTHLALLWRPPLRYVNGNNNNNNNNYGGPNHRQRLFFAALLSMQLPLLLLALLYGATVCCMPQHR